MATKSKNRSAFRCSSCGHQVTKWVGRCPSCQEWGSMEAVTLSAAGPASGGGTGAGRTVNTGGLTPTSPARAVTDIDPTTADHRPAILRRSSNDGEREARKKTDSVYC